MTESYTQELKRWIPDRPAMIAWLAVIGAAAWFFRPSFSVLLRAWQQPEYGHAYFVPVFAVFLLWHRRAMMDTPPSHAGVWWGLVCFLVWAPMRWTAVYFNYGALTEMSILPFLVGLTLLVGGWRALSWAWPAIAFVFFMIPLPGIVAEALSQPLQAVGTRVSVFIIQTLGIPAVAQGNVIVLTEKELGVVEACSGLRMMMLFFAICAGAALVIRKPLWERLVILFSAIPIAVLANVIRISLTAILCEIAHTWPSVISMENGGRILPRHGGFVDDAGSLVDFVGGDVFDLEVDGGAVARSTAGDCGIDGRTGADAGTGAHAGATKTTLEDQGGGQPRFQWQWDFFKSTQHRFDDGIR